MKLSHLKQIVTYLQKFKKISAIYRVTDTTIKIAFDKNDEIYFNMQRSNSTIFKAPYFNRSKIYNAPFDVMLAKRFNRSNILSTEIINNDKVIKIKTSLASAYKEETTYLQLEFTGKYTNAIILDDQNRVIEALRHIDLFSSFREVKVGQKLLPVPKAPFEAKEYKIDDIEKFLYDRYKKEQQTKLDSLKKQKTAFLTKKLKKLQKLYNKLDDVNSLQKEAKKFEYYGNLVLSNLHNLKPYQKVIKLNDYNNEEISIKLDKEFGNVSKIPQYLFTKSKKAKQRENTYI